MKTKIVSSALSMFAIGAVAISALPGCAAGPDIESVEAADMQDTDDVSDEIVDSSAQAASVPHIPCNIAAYADFMACYNEIYDVCISPDPFGIGGGSPAVCASDANAGCKPKYDQSLTICNNLNYAAIHRVVAKVYGVGTFHLETMVPNKYRPIESSFYFAASPQAGADQSAIRHCRVKNSNDDFLSHSSTCEGQTKISTPGYSFAANTPGAKPVYRCVTGKDHFISRDSKCEGKISEGLLGYAK